MTQAYPIILLIILFSLSACSKKEDNKKEVPDYATVFSKNQVQRIEILMDSTNWKKIESNLRENFGKTADPTTMHHRDHPTINKRKMLVPPPKPKRKNKPIGHHPPLHAKPTKHKSSPIWVESEIKYNDKIWSHVGIRVKGNSSLRNAYKTGSKKYSFKLDFDQFEDTIPSIKNQRFYGFKQLNLNNNFDDPSLMREKLAADLFRDFGLVAARASFYEVYVDFGTGKSECLGIYTLLEEMDDTPIKTQLGTKKGNLYKPENRSATFEKDHLVEDDLNKKNNRSKKDYSDIKIFHNILHSTERTSMPKKWKKDLEEVFNVAIFLKWLAVNTTIQNWDSYGRSPHNYYLYNNPADSLLTWIPWDHNEAFQKGKSGGALDLSMELHGEKWPIIEYLLSVPEYRDRYHSYLYSFTKDVFSTNHMTNLYTQYAQLLKPYIHTENEFKSVSSNHNTFERAIEVLTEHVKERNKAVALYLNKGTICAANNE